MNGDEHKPDTFSVARRFGAGLNLLITLVAVGAIVAMVNHLAMRRFVRMDWAKRAETELSSRTKQVIGSLTNTVKVITYFDSHDSLYPRVRAILKEYENASGGKIVVQHVDYIRQPSQAAQVRSTYDLPSGDRDLIVFVGQRRVVKNASTLSDYSYNAQEMLAGKTNEVHRTHFKGEQVFTAALLEASTARSPKAYFLIGHGEYSPSDTSSVQGYSKFTALLNEENNFVCQIADLISMKEVPPDCSLLIIPGPRDPLSDVEVERVARYLDQGGRLLVLFSHRSLERGQPTGLEKLLAAWGIQVDEDIILDTENATAAQGLDPMPINPGSHQIVNSLGNSRVHFVLPRSLHMVKNTTARRDDVRVDELLFTGRKTEAIRNLKDTIARQVGPQPLAVAAERSIPGLERGATRIVALGDASIWSNQMIEGGANRDFATATVNWLVQQDVLITDIPRRAIGGFRMSLSQGQLTTIRLLLLLAMPGAVLAVGALVWLRRRN